MTAPKQVHTRISFDAETKTLIKKLIRSIDKNTRDRANNTSVDLSPNTVKRLIEASQEVIELDGDLTS